MIRPLLAQLVERPAVEEQLSFRREKKRASGSKDPFQARLEGALLGNAQNGKIRGIISAKSGLA